MEAGVKQYATRAEALRALNKAFPKDEDERPMDTAISFLRRELRLGNPIRVQRLMHRGMQEGLSHSTIYRAASFLKVKSETRGFGKEKRSTWRL